MDSLITYDEAAEFLKNLPLLLPRPDFSNGHGTQATCMPPKRSTRMDRNGLVTNGVRAS